MRISRFVLRLRPDPEGADDLAGVKRLPGAGDDARTVEIDDAVSQHLGMHAQVAHPALEQQRADRVRHRADAELQATAVLDLGGDRLRDRAIGVGGGRVRDLRGGAVVALDDVVDLALVRRVLEPVEVRQPSRLLDDHELRALDDRAVPERGEAEIEEAVLVLRAGLENGDLRRVDEAPVVVRDLTQVARDVVREAPVALCAVIAGVVPVEPVEVVTARIGLEHGARPQRQAGADLHVLDLVHPLRERGVEHIRLTEARSVLDPVAGANERSGAGAGDPLRLLALQPGHPTGLCVLSQIVAPV